MFENIKNETQIVKWVLLESDAKLPSKKQGDAGFDIYTTESSYVLMPHTTHMFPTGIASILSPNTYFQLFERGSTGSKGIAQRCGVIDASFNSDKGWFIPLTNTTDKPIIFTKKRGFDERYEANDVEVYFKNYVLTAWQRVYYKFARNKYKKVLRDYYNSLTVYDTNKAIAQAVLLPVYDIESYEATRNDLFTAREYYATLGNERGNGCLGSSGK